VKGILFFLKKGDDGEEKDEHRNRGKRTRDVDQIRNLRNNHVVPLKHAHFTAGRPKNLTCEKHFAKKT